MELLQQSGGGLTEKYAGLIEQFAEFLLVAVALYLVGRLLVEPAFTLFLERSRFNVTLRQALKKVVRGLIVVGAVVAGGGAAGFGAGVLGSAIVTAGITLALGFAAQDVLANFVSGAFIIQDPKLNVGDTVEIDGTVGTIRDISFRVTRIRTPDNETVLVPNSELTTTVVINRTVNDLLGLSYEFGISYDDDLSTAQALLREVAASHPDIRSKPEPTVHVTDLAETDVVVTVRVWLSKTDRERYAEIRSGFLQQVTERFGEAGIDLSATSQHDLSGEVAVRSSDDETR